MKSTFQREIQEKLNELGYLQRPNRNHLNVISMNSGEINARRNMPVQTLQRIHDASKIYSSRYDAPPPISPFRNQKSQIKTNELRTDESLAENDFMHRSFEIEEALTKRPSQRVSPSLQAFKHDTSMSVHQSKQLSLPYLTKTPRQIYQSMELISSKTKD